VVQTSAHRLTADQVLEVVRAAIATVLELDPARIDAATTLADLGADSLALVVMAELLEEQVGPSAPPGYRIGDRELAELRTVGDVADLVLASL
jgi:acyl carrier protein